MGSRIQKLIASGKIKENSNNEIINKFLSCFNAENKLFYPSSGFDITDIIYMNHEMLDELAKCSPMVYIHSDFMHRGRYYELESINPSFNLKRRAELFIDDCRSILICEVRQPGSDSTKWLIHFGGFFNEEILKINPKQKAIIVSGFAETEDVKEAQRLGAGKYIRKPFTLESIGLAIKETLN